MTQVLAKKSKTHSGSQRGTRTNHIPKPPPIAKSISDNKKRAKKGMKNKDCIKKKKKGMKNKDRIKKKKKGG